jgi:hypothetical protein
MTSYGRIQWRRDSAADWVGLNPILLDGEVGYESDTGRLKIGNGVSTWTALPYFGSTSDFAQLIVWEALQKPLVIAAGDNPAEARSAIGAISPDEVDSKFAALIGGAPEAYDTLIEIANKLASDDTVLSAIQTTLAGKQDKDTDLDAIAALSTTSFGRGLLTLANAAALLAAAGAQAAHARLTNLSGLAIAAGSQVVMTQDQGASWTTYATSAFVRGISAVADLAAFNNALYVVVNEITANTAYTVVSSDAQKLVVQNNAAANQILIPTDTTWNAPIGTTIGLGQKGAGQTSVAAVTPGTTSIRSLSGYTKLAGQWAQASITKEAANSWWLSGALIA